MGASTTVTGSPGTSLAAQCTGPTVGTTVQAGDVNGALQSIENDISTMKSGSYTTTANVTFSADTVDFGGAATVVIGSDASGALLDIGDGSHNGTLSVTATGTVNLQSSSILNGAAANTTAGLSLSATTGNVSALSGIGHGTGNGVVGLGGGSNGNGVFGTGGATNGNGVVGTSAGTGAGLVGTVGAGGTGPAIKASNGPIAVPQSVGGVSADPGTDQIWAQSIEKAWGNITTTGGSSGTVTVNDGLNIASVAANNTGGGVGSNRPYIGVSLTRAMANTSYVVIATVYDNSASPVVITATAFITSASAFQIFLWGAGATSPFNVFTGASLNVAFRVIGQM